MLSTLHIFPSTAAAEASRQQRLDSHEVLFGTTEVTLKGLTEAIFQVTTDGIHQKLSATGLKMLLKRVVLQRYNGKSGHYAPLAEFPGFIDSLSGFIAELKQASLSPGEFAAIVARLPNKHRLTELADLYTLYEDTLASLRLMDNHDVERLAVAHLRQGNKLPSLFEGIESVRLHAIYDLTPEQITLLCQLAMRMRVTLLLPYHPDREELYAYAGRTAEAIEALDNSGLDLELEFAEPTGPFLTPLLEALDTGNTPLFPGRIELLAAPGTYRECEEIGRRVRLLMEEGIDPVDIAVACRDIRNVGPMFEDVCRRFRIPVSYRRGTPLAISPLVQACMAPFRVVASRFARDELLALYSSSYAEFESRGATPTEVEDVLLSSGYLDETQGSLKALLDRRIASLNRQQRSTSIEERVRQALLPLLNELRGLAGKKTPPEFIACLTSYIDKHHYYRRGISADDERALKRDASAITLFRQLLIDLERDAITLGLAKSPIHPAEFCELLKQGMKGSYLAGERRSGVSIVNFHEARGLSFPHLFICGLNEGVCPARHDGHPLFKETDKALFQKAIGRRLFRSATEKRMEEPLLFYLAIGCAGKSLTLSYSYLDGQGKELLRSPYLDDLLAIVDLLEHRDPVNRVVPPMESCMEREELLNAMALDRSNCFSPLADESLKEPLARIAGNASIEQEREEFFQTIDPADRLARSTSHTGALRAADIRAELAEFYSTPPGNSFAPTTLEDYGACPFRYFLKRILRVAPVEKPDLELSARDEGGLLHTILQEFYRETISKGLLPLTGSPYELELLRKTIAGCCARWEKERYTGEPLLWEISTGKLATLLAGLIVAEGNIPSHMLPQACEVGFEGLEVTTADGSSIFLHGKLDRLDADPARDEVRVVDYKLAGDEQKYRRLLKEEELGESSFQMPVYLLAAIREMEKRTGRRFNRGHALFWLLRKLVPMEKEFNMAPDDPAAGFFATDPTIREAQGEANFFNRLSGKVAAMKEGAFQITPTDCSHCDFGPICRHVATGHGWMQKEATE